MTANSSRKLAQSDANMTAATLSTLGLGVLLVGICLGVLLAHPHPIDKAAQRRRNEATLREVVNEVHANA